MDKRDAAVGLAREGFRIFPLRPNSKIPPEDYPWKAMASADPATADRRWRGRFADHNIGLATGDGLLVLDFDTKKDQPGLRSLDLLEMLHDLPASVRVKTPSGGIHVYLRVPKNVGLSVSVDKIPGFPGVDVRCDGGYVVAPGSTIDGAAYEWC